MNKLAFRLLATVFALFLLPAGMTGAAGQAGALQGEYEFHGRTRVDPPPDEARDTHLGLVLEGTVARDLYRRLRVRAVRDACLDDGSRSKTHGPLRCTETANGRSWRCEFAIQLDKPLLVADGVC
ncbi:hypothetical protein [Accumulibacter sp.]|uniref:hypothetical protein n=1 Tax=Accumulibacter sp. TaxID=2053492 RepID=UPI0025F1EE9F|nr:hypothetical protein [Accumulibacter sp.]MCM8612886.1 hypothetical protein [Accumulibacter sp.]MCM8636655.1 hypothetical protein [Accumulibacter sp.]MCM8638228.1 hypothetical protein [Accumulibacter sp.]